MPKIIVSTEDHRQAANSQAKGKIFEQLMSNVLGHLGYIIDTMPNTNYGGMEIDIEGHSKVGDHRLYAECKCYSKPVDSPKLQQFFGKYMTRWMRNPKAVGLMIAIPSLNSDAKAFYNDSIRGNSSITISLYEEDEVISSLIEAGLVKDPSVVSRELSNQVSRVGEWQLIQTERDLYQIHYVFSGHQSVPDSIALFNRHGVQVYDNEPWEHIKRACSELGDFALWTGIRRPEDSQASQLTKDEIVQVRGSSEWFEYQFPASPRFLVGRGSEIRDIQTFVAQVVERRTSSRGLVLEANSGWGKSSLALAAVDVLAADDHLVMVIDSRSASSARFILSVADFALSRYRGRQGAASADFISEVSGFDSAASTLVSIGKALEKESKCLVVILDQFENLFFQPESLNKIRDTLLQLCDEQCNVILGFAWKSDLIGSTDDFPYRAKEDILSASRIFHPGPLTESETQLLIRQLGKELKWKIRKDMQFFLTEYSQGYPWLLKKLCSHILALKEAGVSQDEIANGILNVEELFLRDIDGLTPEQESVLRYVARQAPIELYDIGENASPEIIQTLVNRRLLVRIGAKYDIYWDIFRDYLNTGELPAQENYILRLQVRSVIRPFQILVQAGGLMDIAEFKTNAQLAEGTYLNVLKQMRTLGLASVGNGRISTMGNPPTESPSFDAWLRMTIRDRLRKNRITALVLHRLQAIGTLNLTEVEDIIRDAAPYISATEKTWNVYSRVLADWLDSVDLATYDIRNSCLHSYDPSTEIRQREKFTVRSRRGLWIPTIQYRPIQESLVRIGEAIANDTRIDWGAMTRSSISKSLSALQELSFIRQTDSTIVVLTAGRKYLDSDDSTQRQIFADNALKISAFKSFVDVISANPYASLRSLKEAFAASTGVSWTQSTFETNWKIMLNWARYCNLLTHAKPRTRKSSWQESIESGQTLLESFDEFPHHTLQDIDRVN